MNSEFYQERKNKFEVGDLVCYKTSGNKSLCGIIIEINKLPKSNEKGEMVKIYWSINKEDVDISPLSYPPVRKDGWIAAGLLQGVGTLEVVSKKDLTRENEGGTIKVI